jgi:predicted PurR-regulated permease PerM
MVAGGVVGALLAVPVVAAAKAAYVELRPADVEDTAADEDADNGEEKEEGPVETPEVPTGP